MFTKNNLKTNAVADEVAKILEAELDEALKGGQKKIDKNHNGKLDAQDFKMLRGEKPVEEAALGVPLKGHPYHKKTDAELRYIQKDAAEAAKAMKFHAPRSEAKYLDQVNDASTVLHYRSKGGKQLAKEEVEELDELSKGTLMSYVKKGEKQQGKNFDDIIAAHKDNNQPKANKANAKYLKRNAGLDRAVDKMYAKYDKPKTEEVESIDEISTAQMSHQGKTTLKHIKNPGVQLRMAAHDVKKGIKGYRDRIALLHAADAEGKLKKEAVEDLEEKKGDTDLGTFTDNNMGEMTDAQMKDRERIVKGMKKGLAGFKERYGKRAKDVMYATATKQATKDESVDPKVKTTDTLAGRIKGGDENQHTSYKVKLKTEAMGCENTPMSRAKNLAKAAYKKLKNETMMGKAGGTSEEKE